MHGRNYSLFLRISMRGDVHRVLSGGKRVGGCHFPPQPFNTSAEQPAKGSMSNTGCLTCLFQVPQPCALAKLPFLVKPATASRVVRPSSRRPMQAPEHTMSLKPGVLKVSRLCYDRVQRAPCCSWREGRQTYNPEADM